MNERNDKPIWVGRSRTYTPHFYSVAKTHAAEFARLMQAVSEAESRGECPPDLRVRYMTGHIVIVFSWMTLESLTYDYAAIYFSDTYAKKYLESMSTLSKLIIVPQLASGKKFPTDGQAYQYLDELQKVRNDLVHSKSFPSTRTDEEKTRSQKKAEERAASFPNQVQHAFAAIEMYVAAVVSMHPEDDDRMKLIKACIST